MINVFLTDILRILIISPILFFTIKNRKTETAKVILVFILFFMLNSFFLYLPISVPFFQIFGGVWNWSGKIYAILCSVLFLLIYRKYNLRDYFITIKQNKGFVKKGIIIILLFLFIKIMVIVFIGSPVKFDIENIFFQLTMPGIEEEIAYRGIMLGLLNKILTPKIKIFDKSLGSPAIWITAILFGLSHGLFITDSFKIIFNYFPFLSAIFSGFIWGWITLRSGSILLSVISHNLTNVINNLIVMIKD